MWLRAYAIYLRAWADAGWPIGVGLVGLVVAIGGLALKADVAALAGVALTVLSVLALAADVRQVRGDLGDLYSAPAENDWRALRDRSPNVAGELVELPFGAALLDPDTCRWLATNPVLPLAPGIATYQLPREVKWAHHKAIVDAWQSGRRDFDARKVRLASDLVPWAPEQTVRLEKTRFVFARVTNDLAERSFWSRREHAERLGPAIPFPNNSIPVLAASQCSNHVGVDTVTFLPSGRLVLGVQSLANAQSPGLLASSGSGSADWNDLTDTGRRDLLTFVRRAMARELIEECGLSAADVSEQETVILGYARFLHRGGKPQFFGWTPTTIAEHQLRRVRGEKRYVHDHRLVPVDWDDAETWRASLRRFLAESTAQVSVPLHLNLTLLIAWSESDPANWERLRRTTLGGVPDPV
jgi:8-oxo-dGTP pyrophosphatase MutT (NUDIX family)